MNKAWLAVAVAAAWTVLSNGAAAGDPASPPPRSRQAVFNEGQAAYAARHWKTAIADFTEVLAASQSQGRSDAVIRTRLADALIGENRLDEAETQARQAVALLRTLASGRDANLADAYLTLGDALRIDLSYEEAITAFKAAQAAATGPDAADQATEAAIGLAQASMVTHPALAAATLDSMIADQAAFGAQSKEWRAQILSMRARAELNRGDAKNALPFIEKALALQGSMDGDTLSLYQANVRADAALVYSMLHRDDETRRYLSYSGAGHLPRGNWRSGAEIEPPVCGPDIAPEDSAVVAFAIGANGRTIGVEPVWSSRPGETGLAFARAVRGWQWRPDAVAELEDFWRQSIRIELRCALQPPPLALVEPFVKVTRDWLASHGDSEEIYDLGPQSQATPEAAPPADMARITALFRRLRVEYSPGRAAADASQLDALLVQAGAPVEARALAADAAAWGYWKSERASALNAALSKLDKMAGGQRSAAWLRVEQAVALESAGNFAGAKPPLEAVVALSPDLLASDDPIRSVAILHLSLIDRRDGNPLAAQTRLNLAGLTVQKCDLLDVKPIATNLSTSGTDFPDEASRWGFEGWVEAGFDIGADGGVKGVRALIAYPPFVFDGATGTVVSKFRYLPPILGDTALGCTGQTQVVQYRLPDMKSDRP